MSIDIYSQKIAERLPVDIYFSEYFTGVMERRAEQKPRKISKLWSDFVYDYAHLKKLRKLPGTLHFSHQHFGRFGRFLARPYIITCHDIIRYLDMNGDTVLQKRPEGRSRLYLGLDFAGTRRASRIVAISDFTKRELIERLGVAENKVEVIYPGVDHDIFKPRSRTNQARPYILYTGSEVPRKNFLSLIDAFRELKREASFSDLMFVKVGASDDAHMRAIAIERIRSYGLGDAVRFTGRITDDELAQYYTMAECFIFPSFYEGFGLPPLEAMACGCPVIVANAAALPEVVGEAGLKVDPSNVKQLTDTLRQVLMQAALRRKLSLQGLERASAFSWDRAAEQTARFYEGIGV
ncbi:MAG TPA: glycosyltransferase family 1 protein [Candidatus Saccharimonadales bacterium]|nr:glycosyltransferase family 1 protein [Candidatus Saccharimonadales bacterium]